MRVRPWFLALVSACLVAGCGDGNLAQSPPGDTGSIYPRAQTQAAVGPYNVSLSSGWNSLGLSCYQVTSLSGTSGIAALATWEGNSYRTGSFSVNELNSGDGCRRGFWVYATSPTTFSYSGTSSEGATVNLRSGWNLISCPTTSASLPGSALTCRRGGTTVPLSSVLVPQFYELGPSGYTVVDVSASGQVRPGQAYWVYALDTVTMSYGSAPPATWTVTVESVNAAIAADPVADWVASATSVSNLTLDQFKALQGALPSTAPDRVGARREEVAASALPATFGWDNNRGGQNWLTPVKVQQPHKTCISMATVGALETKVKLYYNDAQYPVDLSEWCLIQEAGIAPDEAWTAYPALQRLMSPGTVEESVCPYSSNPFTPPPVNSTRYLVTGHEVAIGVAAMKQHLVDDGPLVAVMQTYEDFSLYGQENRFPVKPYRHVKGADTGLHAILIVGWFDDPGVWICRNSWGSGWGYGGYFALPFEEGLEKHSIDGVPWVLGHYLKDVKIVTPSPSPGSSPTPAPSPSPGLASVTTGAWPTGKFAQIPVTIEGYGVRFTEDAWVDGWRDKGERWICARAGGPATVRGSIICSGPAWSYEDYTYSIVIRINSRILLEKSGTIPKEGGTVPFTYSIPSTESGISVTARVTGGNPESSSLWTEGAIQ